jgi:hypothetical protein
MIDDSSFLFYMYRFTVHCTVSFASRSTGVSKRPTERTLGRSRNKDVSYSARCAPFLHNSLSS